MMNRPTLLLVSLFSLVAALQAAPPPSTAVAPDAPAAPTLVHPQGKYEVAWLTLKGPAGEGKLFLAFRAGKGVQAWFIDQKLPGAPKASGSPRLLYEGNTLQCDGKSLAGKLDLRLVSIWAPIKRLALLNVTFDAKVSDGKIAGTWTLAGDAKGGGELAGAIIPEEDMAKANAFAAGKDWPAYFGLEAAGRGPDCGRAMIDDLAKSVPMWKSEETIPCAWGTGVDGRYADRAAMGTVVGGASTPILAGGRIYHFYYYPSGPVDEATEAAAKKFSDLPIEQKLHADFSRTRADVIVLCMDAATGKTIWKSTWPLKTGNFQTHKWRGYNPTPVVADGVLYVADYSSRYYAYDAATGDLKWEYGAMASKAVGGNQAHSGPIVAGGVVVAMGSGGIVGLDPKTGQQAWKAPAAINAKKWTAGGKDYLIAERSAPGKTKGEKNESIACIDAATGKELWTAPVELVLGDQHPIIAGDTLVGYVVTKAGNNDFEAAVTAYKLSPAGAQKAWISDPIAVTDILGFTAAKGYLYVSGAKEVRCLDLATGQQLAKAEGVGGARTQHMVTADGRLVLDPEGRHGRTTLFLLNADPKDLRKLGEEWTPPFPTTTAYANMPIYHPLVDGRLIVKGFDGLYAIDLRK